MTKKVQTSPTYSPWYDIDGVKMYDPDPDTIAMICEPGILEKVVQAPLKSSSIYNDLTLTQNFIFSQPNISYRYIPYKGCIVVKRNSNLENRSGAGTTNRTIDVKSISVEPDEVKKA